MNLFSTPKAPDPNPGMIASAQSSERVGLEQVALGREQFEWNKQNEADNRALSAPIIASQVAQAEKDQAFNNSQRDYYRDVYQPVERQSVADAMGYDSAANLERVAGEAQADVVGATSRARQGLTRDMARIGLDPSSSRAMTAISDSFSNGALAEASAMNAARRGREDAGIALRTGVANFGRNMPNTAAQSNQLAQSNNNSAVGNQLAVGNQAIQGANSTLGFTGQGLQGVGQAGNIYNQDFGQRFQNYNAQMNQQNAFMGALGTAGGIAGARLISDYSAKEDRESAEGELMLDGLQAIPIESWKYKDGGGQHVGPMAQDVNMMLGEKAAPGGTSIDLITMNGMMMMGLKELTKEVRAMKSGKGTAKARSTEPVAA